MIRPTPAPTPAPAPSGSRAHRYTDSPEDDLRGLAEYPAALERRAGSLERRARKTRGSGQRRAMIQEAKALRALAGA